MLRHHIDVTIQNLSADTLDSPVFIASLGTNFTLSNFKYLNSNGSFVALDSSIMNMADVDIVNTLSRRSLMQIISATNVTIQRLTMVIFLSCHLNVELSKYW